MIRDISSQQSLSVRRMESPRVVDGDPNEAMETAIDLSEPVFLKSEIYTDDRGWSLMNQLQGVLCPEGQVNYSIQYPGVIKAWHRHEFQTDFWLCLNGHLKAGIYRESDETAWASVIGEKRPGILVIPPTLWHGATTVGPTSAGLLYYVTRAYNPALPDEERRSAESISGFPWNIQHR
ncbi:MAG: hypothetical protein AAGG48_21270 [Planctomycetota bacterium]